MDINAANLEALRLGYSTAYQAGIAGAAASQHGRIATEVPASAKTQKYGWLGKFPKVSEWIGQRQVHKMAQHGYSITEKPWELTIAVDKDDIETDNIGIYTPMFQEMGASTVSQWDILVFELLVAGFSETCYDGQPFFDDEHPVLSEDGVTETLVANTDGGSGTPWFLLCTNRPLKPIILQKRKDFQFVAKDDPASENVFNNKEFVYGADARGNVGYGFWQQAWGSKQPLNGANYGTGRAALSGMKGDHGRPLGQMPNLLVVSPSQESEGRKLLNSEYGTGGVTNEWKGTAELLVCPWLA